MHGSTEQHALHPAHHGRVQPESPNPSKPSYMKVCFFVLSTSATMQSGWAAAWQKDRTALTTTGSLGLPNILGTQPKSVSTDPTPLSTRMSIVMAETQCSQLCQAASVGKRLPHLAGRRDAPTSNRSSDVWSVARCTCTE